MADANTLVVKIEDDSEPLPAGPGPTGSRAGTGLPPDAGPVGGDERRPGSPSPAPAAPPAPARQPTQSPPEQQMAGLTEKQQREAGARMVRVMEGLRKQKEEEEQKQRDEEEAERKGRLADYKKRQQVLESLKRQREKEEAEAAKQLAEAQKEKAKREKDLQDARRNMYEGVQAAAAAAGQGTNTASGLANAGLQVAGSGLLGKEAAASALKMAPEISAFAMILDVAAEKVAGSFDKVRGGIAAVGETAQKVVRDDGWGLANAAVDGFTKQLEEVPIVGKMYAAEMKAAAEPFRQVKAVFDTLVDRGKSLSQYSGPAAGAVANAEIQNTLNDLKEAQQLGSGYARLIEQQQELDTTVRELLLPIKQFIVEVMADGIGVLVDVARDVKGMILVIQRIGDVADGFSNGKFGDDNAKFVKEKEFERFEAREGKLKDAIGSLTAWTESIMRMPGLNNRVPNPDKAEFDRAARLPLGVKLP